MLRSLALFCLALPLFAQEPPAQPAKPEWNVNQPPGEAFSVPIDTRTGTWMSVDVRPDGQELVFDLLGDLYLLPIAGGQARPLTTSIAWEMQPRYSPDGKSIAYMSDAGGGDNIWVMNADGTAPRAVTGEKLRLLNNPVWHPQGQYIAARKHFAGTRSLGSGEIWLYHKGGGDGVQLNEKPNWQKDLGEPAFSPDGRYLYYSQDTTPGDRFQYNKNSNAQIYQIFQRDLEEGKTRALVSGPGGAVRPTPSPDGQWLAFVRRVRNQSTLFLKNLTTGEEMPAWGELERDLQEAWAIHGVYPAFAWMPDSKEIVVWAKGRLWRVDPFAGKAREIAFHVQHKREVRKALRVPTAVAPERFNVRQLRWVQVAPHGGEVVYSALGYLYRRPLPDGTPRRITQQTTHFEMYPSFSRDGKKLVYCTWHDDAQGSIRVRDLASGSEEVLATGAGKFIEPRFSPDGREVAYVRVKGGVLTSPWHALETGIYRIALAGGRPQRVSDEGRAPQYGADAGTLYSTRLVKSGDEDWSTQLIRHRLDRQEAVPLVKGDFVTDYAVSPDGRWLAYRERYHTFVLPLPRAGRLLTVGDKAKPLPVRRLDVNAGDDLHWSGDGRTLHFALGDQLFSRPLREAFDFIPGAPAPLPKPGESGRPIGFTHPAAAPDGTLVLSGARIVTMQGDQVIEEGRIVMRGNRIAAIGPAADVAIPDGARTLDLRGKTILPGLVDVHWHGPMGEDGIIPRQSWVNHASLAFGVTTLHDPSNHTATIFSVAEMQRAGHVLAPRIYSTGTILYGAKSNSAALVDSLDDALTHLKRMRAAGATTVKSYNQPRRDQRQQILEAARQTNMMVLPEGASLFQHNMTMVVDGHTGIEHAIPVPSVYDDVRQLWSATAVGYTPTLAVAYGGLDGEHYWYSRTDVWRHPLLTRHVPRSVLWPRAIRRETAPEEDFNVIQVARTATDLQRAGVPVNIGAHGQREGLAAHWEMWTLVLGGMTPLEAIRSATLNGARYLGMDADIGSLEVGKLADLVVIEGNPLQDIRTSDKVSYVMLNGRLYEAATLNETLTGSYRRAPYFFEGRGVATPVDAEAQGALATQCCRH